MRPPSIFEKSRDLSRSLQGSLPLVQRLAVQIPCLQADSPIILGIGKESQLGWVGWIGWVGWRQYHKNIHHSMVL